jgi:hypothetical protein
VKDVLRLQNRLISVSEQPINRQSALTTTAPTPSVHRAAYRQEYKNADLWRASIRHRSPLQSQPSQRSQLRLHEGNIATAILPVAAPQQTASAHQASQPNSPPLAPASPLLLGHRRATRGLAITGDHRITARKNADTSTGYPAATRASPGLQQARPASDKRPCSGTTVSPPSLAQAKSIRREFSPVFIRHAPLPYSPVIFILTAINICYRFTWLSPRASTFHTHNSDHYNC